MVFQKGVVSEIALKVFAAPLKECVAVLIELYKKNVTVSCVGSDLLSELTYTTEPRVVGTILEYYVRSD